MDTTRFDRSMEDLTASLGDPTRRGIYVSVREAGGPTTAMEIAELFSIHPNVARHHLDRLAADGYLEVTRRRRSGKTGPGAGRPAKCYEATDKEITVQFPPRRHDLLSELLVQVVERVAPDTAPQVAEEVGRAYGRQLAAEIGEPQQEGFDGAVTAVARALTGVGFEISKSDDELRLLTTYCPFGATAAAHPEVVCKIDQGIVKGMMEALGEGQPVVVTPHSAREGCCVTEF